MNLSPEIDARVNELGCRERMAERARGRQHGRDQIDADHFRNPKRKTIEESVMEWREEAGL